MINRVVGFDPATLVKMGSMFSLGSLVGDGNGLGEELKLRESSQLLNESEKKRWMLPVHSRRDALKLEGSPGRRGE